MFLYPRIFRQETLNGGVEEFLFYVTRALAALGVESIIYSGDKSCQEISAPQPLFPGVTVYHGPFIRPRFFVSKKALAPVVSLCRELNVDVLHAQGTYSAGFLARQLAKFTKIPYVVTSHSDILTTNSKRINRTNVRRRCRKILRDAKMVTHLTPYMAEQSHVLYDTRAKSMLIENGVKPNQFLGLPEKDYLLGLGRLVPGKGFHVLINMYAKLLQKGITTSLIIAGRGPAEQELQDQVKQLGINLITHFDDFSSIPKRSVIFTGLVLGDKKEQLIAQCRCLLFSTQPALWDEAFGIVLLEAMAAGRAMVASDTPPTRYLEELGMKASIVQPDDVDAWVHQVATLLQDATFRSECGAANIAVANQLDWSIIAAKYKIVYEKCIQA